MINNFFHKNFSRLGTNALSGIFQSSLNIFLVLISYPAYLYFLGVELYGLWAALSVIIVLSQMGNLSIHTALSKHIASSNNLKQVWQLLGASLSIILAVCMLIIFMTVFLKNSFIDYLELDTTNTAIAIEIFPYIGFLAALIILVELLKGILIGFGYMYFANFTSSAARLLQFIVSIFLLYAGLGIEALLYGTFIAYFFLGMVLIVLSKNFLDSNFLHIFSFNKTHIKKLSTFGLYTSSTPIVNVLIDSISKILITKNLGLDLVTFYEAGHKVIQILAALFDSAARAIMPEISKLSKNPKKNLTKIKTLKSMTSRFILLALVPISLLIISLGNIFFSIWLQDAYDDLIYYAAILFLIGYVFNIISIPYYHISIAVGNTFNISMGSVTRLLLYLIVLIGLKFFFNDLNFYTFICLASCSIIPEALIFINTGLNSIKNISHTT